MPGPAASATNVGASSRSPVKQWLPGLQALQSGKEKLPAAAHAAAAGPQDLLAPAACGASTLKTLQALKSAPFPCL